MTPVPLWRVFAWDPDAAEGERFSASFVPGGQGSNRFDLDGDPRGVIYLAQSEDHAVAEMVQGLRNGADPLANDDLAVSGRRYAIAPVTLTAAVWAGIADLCEPSVLADLGITADRPAMPDRANTRRIAATLHDLGRAGLRWWWAFWGEWHTVVLFRARIPTGALTCGEPVPLDVTTPSVQTAARLLDIG